MNLSWKNFCSTYPNSTDSKGNLQIWLAELQDFSECFHDVYQAIGHAILLAGTVFFVVETVSRRRPRIRVQENKIYQKSWILRIATVFAILMTLVIRQIVLLVNVTLRQKLGIASHVHQASAIFAWTAMFYQSILLVRQDSYHRRDREKLGSAERQLMQFFLWLPVLGAAVFELWSAIGGVYEGMPILYSICIYVLFGCHLLLLLSFLGPIWSTQQSHGDRSSEAETLVEQEEDQPEEELPSIASNHDDAGIFSKVAISWAGALIRNGRHGLKSAEDLFSLPRTLEFCQSGREFRRRIAEEPKVSRIFLIRVIWKMWGPRWLFIGFLALLSVASHYATPVFLQKLVEFFETDRTNMADGCGWAAGMLAASLFSSLLNTHYHLLEGKLSLCVTGVLIDSVYRKLFSVHIADLTGSEVSGKVVNLIGTDCGRINDGLVNLHSVWALPLQIIIALYLLYLQVGVAFLGGIGVVLVLLAGNQYVSTRLVSYEEKKQTASDARVKIIQEILNCIRVIKFHAWEKFFQDRVTLAREKELRYLRGVNIFIAIISCVWQIVPVGMAVATFLIYVLMGNTLTAAKVFTSIALFRMLTEPLMTVAWAIIGTTEMWVSVKRLQDFFKLPDLSLSRLYETIDDEMEEEIECQEAEFSAQTSAELLGGEISALLHKMTLSIKPGEFLGVTGRIGSGKSVLLNSLIGELQKTSGKMAIKRQLLEDGFGYAPQEPWILQGTIRNNILFGIEDETDLPRYQEVLECCALTEDLQNLPGGDSTEIGERGVTLSGGQKARLSLARAVYQNKNVILLDDPLSAVDPHVAATIYTKCIRGILKSKTRILVTHNVECLRDCDRVVVMKNGAITAIGPPEDVLSLPDLAEEDNRPQLLERQASIRSFHSQTGNEDEDPQVAPLVEEEESMTGVVKWAVYVALFRAIGWPSVLGILILAFLNQAGVNACDIWISYWIGHTNATFNGTEETKLFLTVYGSIAGSAAVLSLTWPFVMFFGFLRASRIFHQLLLDCVLKAKMQFFDATPSGRILNRFSKDTNSMDDMLPLMTLIFLAELCGVTGTLAVVIYSMPWFIPIVVPVLIVYYLLQAYYRHTARELKRLNATSLSPMYSLYAESIQGLTTIRSMRASDRFCRRFSKLLFAQQRVQFAMLAAEQWLELRLEFLGILLIFGVLLVGFLASSQSAAVGLALSYSLSVVQALIALVDSFIRFEKSMVYIERIKQYVDDVEPEIANGPLMTTPDWPTNGTIDIDQLCVRYRADLPDVLDNIRLQVRSGEKIGIVGRTGAGKSSLMLALFRIMEARAGSITIDGVKIANLNLQHLRSRLTIIPQTASLFDASIRDNLDPLSRYSDDQIWTALEKCHLRPLLDKLGGALSSRVGENGKKLSAGEKQLVSLARALLSNSKIICLDEATANIDFETDKLVQQTIRECLVGSTILTIAHRVQTVMDCDRVVVMSNGRICEEGHPGHLMEQPDSRFYQLVQQSKSVGEIQ